MYHRTLKIAIFSGDRILEETVCGIRPLERFTHIVTRSEMPEPRFMADSDIILWDLPWDSTVRALKSACGAGAYLVFCAPRSRLERCGPEEYEAAEEFWETPLRYQLAAHRCKRILERIRLEQELYLSNACLDTAIDSIPDMMWFKTLDGIHAKVNRAFCAVVGKSRRDVTGRDHCYIWGVSRDDPNSGEAVCKRTEDAVIQAGHTLQFTENVKSQHGMRQLTTYKSPIYDRDGSVLGTVGFGHDVTDLENMSTEIEILLRSMPYAILLRDNGDHIFDVNRKFEEYFCVSKESVIGKKYEQWAAAAFEAERRVNTEGFIEANVRLKGGGGKTLEIHEDKLYDIFDNEAGQICIFRDVTMERQLEAQILQNSNTDFMTGLYNRRCLYQYVRSNCQGKTVSLLYVDLDRFKQINDTYGHKVGDDALILTAGLLQEWFVRDFVARIGGDEFLIVKIGEFEVDDLVAQAQALLKKLHGAYHAAPHLEELSASIGIAQCRKEQTFDIDLLIQHSDAALYQAKQLGRSRCCVYASAPPADAGTTG